MSDQVEDAKESLDSGHNLTTFIGIFVGGYVHVFGLHLFVVSLTHGGTEYTDLWAGLGVWGYGVVAACIHSAENGRKSGETGVRYIARIAISPYSKAGKLSIVGARAAPGFLRGVYAWLVKPKEADEDDV